MIEYKKARRILSNSTIKILNEKVLVNKSLNRVAAKNIYSQTNYPAGHNTAFDGYAVKSNQTSRLSNKNTRKFKILKTLAAGDSPVVKKIKKYSAIEVMTGAIIPKYFDTVIPIESVNFYPNKKKPKFILINKKIKKFNHIRFAGSDYKKGDKIISKGETINSSHILAFKSLGIKKISVKKKPIIIFYSTGNELSEKVKIPAWKVRNSNRDYVHSLSNNSFFKVIDGGILRDKDDKTFKKLIKKNLNSKFNIIVTNGAVSKGKFDFVPKVINNFKWSKHFKDVAIRPGKPIMFVKFKNKNHSFFGLPGNPISSAACFKFFVYPYIRLILNMKKERSFKAKLKEKFIKKKKFTRFVKSKVIVNKKGFLEIKVLKGQESFKIKSFTKSNAWALFKSGKATFKKGELIDCFDPL